MGLMQVSRDYPVITFGECAGSNFVLSIGEPSRIRTCDLLIKSQLLYRLSYGPTWERGYPRGRRRARRSLSWRIVRDPSTRQFGAMAASGWRTKFRLASSGWGIVSRREFHFPPLHSTRSRSRTRGPQRRPRRRPNSRSMALRRLSITGGSRSLSMSATVFAKSRPAPPCAALRMIGEASKRAKSWSSRAIAASTTCGGRPYRPWQRFDPIAIAYRYWRSGNKHRSG